MLHSIDLTELFVLVDDSAQAIEAEILRRAIENDQQPQKPTRIPTISAGELITILLHFHASGYRCFKYYYEHGVKGALSSAFPGAPSYSRFLSLMKRYFLHLYLLLYSMFAECDGISFVDSTPLSVCHICRAYGHRVMAHWAKKGKTTTGWFYGLKLHLIINSQGELLSFAVTSGNVDDRKPVPFLAKDLVGSLFGDRGYISQSLFDQLSRLGVFLVTRLRQNMKQKLMLLKDKILLRKRGIIESVFSRLKLGAHLDHHRHRSPIHFFMNILSALAAYQFSPSKPSIFIPDDSHSFSDAI